MALYGVVTALFLALALARVELSSCHVLKGSLTCLDCHRPSHISGIKILVKCSEVKKLAMATTTEDGSFETELPSDTLTPPPSPKCRARVLGGPNQIYASQKTTVSPIVKARDSDSYTISNPLSFYKSCPSSQKKDGKCGATGNKIRSSKTVDLPLPREWGLAPTSYYVPFLPIIGIP